MFEFIPVKSSGYILFKNFNFKKIYKENVKQKILLKIKMYWVMLIVDYISTFLS